MINKRTIVFVLLFLLVNAIAAQTGMIIRFTSSHAMFPDTARAKGHDYNGRHYDAITNYSDSSILIYVPKGFSELSGKINLVFWFHGWGNSIDSAINQHQLLQQFDASGRNAVFVFPEGPKNAPDSYGGKLEQPEIFQQLVREVGKKLYERVIRAKIDYNYLGVYDITLAGHSGAYRVISHIINKTPVSEVILFDAMYGGNDAYLQWLSVPEHRFINIYTKDGGTFDNSHLIMKQLTDSLHIPMISLNEDDVNEKSLRDNKKLFLFSSKGHNEVITNNRNWERFLRSIPAKK
jgi:predicted esterase